MIDYICRLSLRGKFMLITVAMLVPISVLSYISTSLKLEKIQVARLESAGLDWATRLVKISLSLTEYREQALAVAGGAESEKAEMTRNAGVVRDATAELDGLVQAGNDEFAEQVGWTELRGRIIEAIEGNPVDAKHLREGPVLVVDLGKHIRSVADRSGLILDPGADTFPLMYTALFDLPAGIEALDSSRRAMDHVAGGDSSTSTFMTLAAKAGEARKSLDSAMHFLNVTYTENVTNASEIPAKTKAMSERVEAALTAVERARTEKMDEMTAFELSDNVLTLNKDLHVLRDEISAELGALLTARARTEVVWMLAQMGLVLICALAAFWLQKRVARYIDEKLQTANSVFAKLQHGEFDSEIGEQYGDELGALLTSLRDMQTGLATRVETDRQTAEADRARAVASERIKQALDSSSVNVVVADDTFNVIYVNPAAQKLLSACQADFRQVSPRFDAARLVGSSLEVFYADGARQREQLAALRQSATTQFTVGSRTLQSIASPIVDGDGKRIGTVVEWLDRTQEVAAEKEIGSLVEAVTAGKLDQRISLSGKTGFFEVLARGLNGVVGTVSDVVAELRKLVQGANDGDLTRNMDLDGKSGLYVSIGSGVNSLVGNMARVVAEVKHMSVQVQSGAEEISKGNLDLSQRTEEQASSLEETASSMEEMTSTVKQTADNAGQANQLALAARQQAEKGGAVVSSAVSAMGEINAASKKIADIIGVIDEIAFQTNLLALNAAVEAARAGEQGRGFAVVATEVRNLAGRSATAAKEIKALIQDSVAKVDEGSRLVDQSGQTLEEIVMAVKKVTDIVAEIAAASREQSSGIEQVNKAIMQMDTTTQQNAALVEQAAAASRAIVEQTHSLADLVARYRVAETAGNQPADVRHSADDSGDIESAAA